VARSCVVCESARFFFYCEEEFCKNDSCLSLFEKSSRERKKKIFLNFFAPSLSEFE